MKLYVPEIGDQLTLSQDWIFNLYDEYRNDKFIKFLKLDVDPRHIQNKEKYREETKKYYEEYYKRSVSDGFLNLLVRESYMYENVRIPKDSILTIDRIYIRKGNKDYSSLTFRLKLSGAKNTHRFWAKLADCNRIEFNDM